MITMILLWVPLVVATAMTIVFLFSDEDRKWKIACAAAVAASLALRFAPGLHVPFIVPFLIEGIVAISLSIWIKAQYF